MEPGLSTTQTVLLAMGTSLAIAAVGVLTLRIVNWLWQKYVVKEAR